jgi:hypothetical protein
MPWLTAATAWDTPAMARNARTVAAFLRARGIGARVVVSVKIPAEHEAAYGAARREWDAATPEQRTGADAALARLRGRGVVEDLRA